MFQVYDIFASFQFLANQLNSFKTVLKESSIYTTVREKKLTKQVAHKAEWCKVVVTFDLVTMASDVRTYGTFNKNGKNKSLNQWLSTMKMTNSLSLREKLSSFLKPFGAFGQVPLTSR